MKEVISALEAASIPYSTNTPLHSYTTWKIGGPCDLLVFPRNTEEVSLCVRTLKAAKTPWIVIGKGSNLLVSDEGFRGAVLRLSGTFDSATFGENGAVVGAGFSLITLSLQAAKHGFSGLEFASGIPGTVGGAVRMNAGAHGSDISKILSQVLVMNEHGELVTLQAKDLSFDYRHSVIQHKLWIVLEATFSLCPGKRSVISEKTKMFKEKRVRTQPLKQQSCGSVFRNPLPLFAAALIECMGLKGYSVGGAKFSEIHANFIVNTGGATARDVMALIKLAQERAIQEHGVHLKPEVEFVGFN
jgi:UDP-N-acetylmuramate dehydrogenase